MKRPAGGQVARVRPGSIADSAGIGAGDRLLSVNGHILRDVIDFRFFGADEALDLLVERRTGGSQTLHLSRDYGEDLGIEFSSPTFDGIRRCRNHCDFCFVHQMPPGLRPSLYVKDDDYRYSFLFGSFITLTNLLEEDWQRLAEQRLSPLYISVHATDAELRARILGVPAAPDVLDQIQRLGNLGIVVHTQIVVTPGLNDGPSLEQTVRDLAALHPTVSSIALVPVGITRYHTRGLRTLTAQEAKQIVARFEPLQQKYRRRTEVGLVYCSDEFYSMADLPVPPTAAYDGFPQLANGVGLTRELLSDWEQTLRQGGRDIWPHDKVTLVCGTLIAPTMQKLVSDLTDRTDTTVEVVPVSNRFFGPTVTVSGLLMAEDVLNALRGSDLGELVVLPRTMFDEAGKVTLDDLQLTDIQDQLNVRVTMADRLSEILVPQN